MKKIAVAAPAKINLTLDVIGKRPDGYHELETIMHQISLYDRITIEKNGGKGICLYCNREDIPVNEENLAYKAASLFLQDFIFNEGITIWIEKNIPVGAGLGGGSADAAAVLEGLNVIFGRPVSAPRLMEMAAMIGSDVPFCLLGKHILQEDAVHCLEGATALARGRGEELVSIENNHLEYIVLVKPEFSLSTAEVYGAFQMDKVRERPDNRSFVKAWSSCDIINIAQGMVNVLEAVSTEMHPEITDIKIQLRELGARNAIMSGSGPSVFGLYTDGNAARHAARIMKKCYREVYLVSSCGRSDEYAGEKIITRKS